jgi:hypothetical protein
MAEAEVAGSEGFAGRMVTMANEAMLALMVSIGHHTGLFATSWGSARGSRPKPRARRHLGLEEAYRALRNLSRQRRAPAHDGRSYAPLMISASAGSPFSPTTR